MAAQFYRAVRDAARRELPHLAAGHTTALQAAKAVADRLAAEHQLTYVPSVELDCFLRVERGGGREVRKRSGYSYLPAANSQGIHFRRGNSSA